MPTGIIGVEGFSHTADEMTVTKDYVSRIQLRTSFTRKDLDVIAKDCELLAKLLRERPQEMIELLEAAARNELGKARTIANKIGLTEEHFVSQGGGLKKLIEFLIYVVGGFLKFW
jgi:hypothetical protein